MGFFWKKNGIPAKENGDAVRLRTMTGYRWRAGEAAEQELSAEGTNYSKESVKVVIVPSASFPSFSDASPLSTCRQPPRIS